MPDFGYLDVINKLVVGLGLYGGQGMVEFVTSNGTVPFNCDQTIQIIYHLRDCIAHVDDKEFAISDSSVWVIEGDYGGSMKFCVVRRSRTDTPKKVEVHYSIHLSDQPEFNMSISLAKDMLAHLEFLSNKL